jgi:uncharacterized Zn finger protein
LEAGVRRDCWWCNTALSATGLSIRTHGDNLVRCGNCGTIYDALLLLVLPKTIWQAVEDRQGVTVERDGDVLVIREV